jgi:branched-subunit amino acid permease
VLGRSRLASALFVLGAVALVVGAFNLVAPERAWPSAQTCFWPARDAFICATETWPLAGLAVVLGAGAVSAAMLLMRRRGVNPR